MGSALFTLVCLSNTNCLSQNVLLLFMPGQKKHLSTVETAPLSPLAEENLKGWVLAQDIGNTNLVPLIMRQLLLELYLIKIDFYTFVAQRMNDQLRSLEKIPKT